MKRYGILVLLALFGLTGCSDSSKPADSKPEAQNAGSSPSKAKVTNPHATNDGGPGAGTKDKPPSHAHRDLRVGDWVEYRTTLSSGLAADKVVENQKWIVKNVTDQNVTFIEEIWSDTQPKKSTATDMAAWALLADPSKVAKDREKYLGNLINPLGGPLEKIQETKTFTVADKVLVCHGVTSSSTKDGTVTTGTAWWSEDTPLGMLTWGVVMNETLVDNPIAGKYVTRRSLVASGRGP
jgi:hypothetical protein